MTRIVVTGIGAVTPAGVGTDALWRRVLSGRSCVERIDRFDPAGYRCQVAGHARGFDPGDWIPRRLLKRTDRFTHLAIAAADLALADSELRIGDGQVRPDRVGLMVGNVLGGWAFAEREVRDLWTRGPRAVSPYQATAWFPAAAQGNINIRHGIKGRSRTFVCDRASGAYALIDAAQSIRRGKADVVLAGGTEQPLSPYAWLCCETGGFMTGDGNGRPDAAYRPFDRRHNGMVIGEGSVFLVLESLEHARARGAKVYGEISGWAASSDGYMPYYTVQPDGRTLAATMEQSLRRSSLTTGDLGLVVADAAGVPREDASEVAALRAALCDNGATVPVTSPKPVLSHLMGAAAVADVAVALRAMAEGTIPPIANLDTPAPGFDLDLVSGTPRTAKALRHCLVVSRGLGGVNACLVISAPDSTDTPMAA